MPSQNANEIKGLGWKIVVPVVIGLAVVVWLFVRDFSIGSFSPIHFGWRAAVGVLAALVFVAGRDFGLTWRFHTIAWPDLSWRRSLRVDLMCAFTSAITPSAVGGSALAIFYLNTEGVKAGRAATLTLTTLFLDEMFFVVFCPILVLGLPNELLFGEVGSSLFLHGVKAVFWTVYAGIVAYTALLFTGIIWRPQLVRKLIIKCFSIKGLRRWKSAATTLAGNMQATSEIIKHNSLRWWANVFAATTLSWFSRYLIVNALFWGFVPDSSAILAFARQFVVWVLLMVSPTPGSSGISEWLFTEYYGDLIGNLDLALVLAMIWRVITYYVYLVIGICIAPTYFKKNKINQPLS